MKASRRYVVQGSDTTMMLKAASSFGQKNKMPEHRNGKIKTATKNEIKNHKNDKP